MRSLFAPFARNHDRVLVMDRRSTEFTKYAANAMLAMRISFMNEISRLAERVGVDLEIKPRGRASTRWPSSPRGRSSARPITGPERQPCARRWCSTGAPCMTRQ